MASPQAEAMQARHGPVCLKRLLSRTDPYKTAEHQPGRLRGELTSQEIKKYVAICLKPDKNTGPDRCPHELTKTMTDEEFQIVKMWANEILTEDTVDSGKR